MATTVPPSGDSEHSIIEVQLADGNAAAGSTAAGELQGTDSTAGNTAAGKSKRTESSVDDKVMWKQLKSLNKIVFYIELWEYLGNAIGTVDFLWATVILLSGFFSLLSPLDLWLVTIMAFLEGTRVFISKDTSVNQWLFGSTRAFRWDHFCFSSVHGYANLMAVGLGVSISLTPIDGLVGSQIIAGILKVAILAITSMLLTRVHWLATAVLTLFVWGGNAGMLYGSFHKPGFKHADNPKSTGKPSGLMVAAAVGVAVIVIVIVIGGVLLIVKIMKWIIARYGTPRRVIWLKINVSLVLLCLPIVQAKYRYWNWNICIAAVLQIAINFAEPPKEQEQSNALLSGTRDLLLKIFDTIMPILFFWGVMFPLPGISLNLSFYMLLSVIAAVLVGNLQIPVAFLQMLLSGLRLHSLLAGHDYHPLPDGASPNMVPSIVVFYVLELCQGATSILAVILGLFSFGYRRSLVRVLGLTEDWGAKAVNLYYHQACMTIKQKGLFPMEKSTPPSLDSFAIESLGCTSSEMQIVRLHVLDYYLRQGDSKYKSRLIAQIAKDATGIVTKITGTISHLITDEESGGNDEDTVQQTRSSLSLCLNFVRRLAVAGGKIGTRFRQELSGNPILLHSLQLILDLENCQQELWQPTMDVIKLLALHDEATAKEIGTTHAVIPKLMGLFLNTGSVVVRTAAGEVLASLTITSSDNCSTVLDLEAGPAGRRDLIKNLISMLNDDEYISVAAMLLHNLFVNSGDMLINVDLDNDAKEGLKSYLRRVIQIILIVNENEEQQMENSWDEEVTRLMNATLRIASQIGYVIPKEEFAHVLAENLAPNTNNAAAEKLVGNLVDTLKSNREPNREFPSLRRALIEMVISIVEACPEYIEIFRRKGAEEALNMLIGTSSRLEKYKVFIHGEGMVPESAPMQEVVDKAKRLITVR